MVCAEHNAADEGEDAVVGLCSYVSPVLDGAPTASGEVYDQKELTAAARSPGYRQFWSHYSKE